ncbi:MAG TPA: hypothetical protein RMH99_23185 [Sandaracinaceae bacterium LLY-WYZ-13_1]|nr:hypothetical protein [Sandaracinaceae bacterium LLY-WYZ-13_1]
MGELKAKTKQELDELTADLTRLRDEIRLKLHLASMDVQKGFEQMEPEVKELERKTTELTEDEAMKAQLAMKKAKQKLKDLRDRIKG